MLADYSGQLLFCAVILFVCILGDTVLDLVKSSNNHFISISTLSVGKKSYLHRKKLTKIFTTMGPDIVLMML